jgi:hypothetical protein
MSPLRWDKVKFIKFFGRHFSNKGVVKVLGFGFLQAENTTSTILYFCSDCITLFI